MVSWPAVLEVGLMENRALAVGEVGVARGAKFSCWEEEEGCTVLSSGEEAFHFSIPSDCRVRSGFNNEVEEEMEEGGGAPVGFGGR